MSIMKTDCINACISIAHNTGKNVDCAMKQLEAIEDLIREAIAINEHDDLGMIGELLDKWATKTKGK